MRTVGSIIILISLLIGEITLLLDFIKTAPYQYSIAYSWVGLAVLLIIGVVTFILAIVNFFKRVGIALLVLSIILTIISGIFGYNITLIFATFSVIGSVLAILGLKK